MKNIFLNHSFSKSPLTIFYTFTFFSSSLNLKKMGHHGTLEVLLCGAKGLENTDFVKNMDAYVVLRCRSQEQKSSVASGQGSEPEWNENFIFTISDSATDLVLKILDSDVGSADDFVGEATIPLEPVFQERNIPPAVYNVVKDEKYKGEIRLALTFKPEHGGHGHQEEELGGWKDSSADY